MNDTLHQRAKRIHARLAVRAWEYRQRDLAHGVWLRFRRNLVDAEHVFIVSEAAMDELVNEGHVLLPVGAELQPNKRIVFASLARAESLVGGREIAVSLSPELLAARSLVLVGFGGSP